MTKSITRLLQRRGHFDGYGLTGFWYQIDDELATAWHFMSVSEFGEIHNYWVTGDAFHGVSLHMFHPATGKNHVELHGVLLDVPEAERAAILKARSKWEKEYRDTLIDGI